MKMFKSAVYLKSIALLAIAASLGFGIVSCGDVEEVSNNTTEEIQPSSARNTDDSEEEEMTDEEEFVEEYTFAVTNETDNDLVQIQVSEDEATWRDFDLGGEVIAPGDSITLVWDESTNDSACEWSLQGIFDDGEIVGPKLFDFCEEVEVTFYSEGEAATGGSTEEFLEAEALFVEATDDTGITLLSQETSNADKIGIAREFCSAMDEGYSVDDYINETASEEEFQDLSDGELELVGGYLGVVIIASADSYCPEYGDIVANWIEGS